MLEYLSSIPMKLLYLHLWPFPFLFNGNSFSSLPSEQAYSLFFLSSSSKSFSCIISSEYCFHLTTGNTVIFFFLLLTRVGFFWQFLYSILFGCLNRSCFFYTFGYFSLLTPFLRVYYRHFRV